MDGIIKQIMEINTKENAWEICDNIAMLSEDDLYSLMQKTDELQSLALRIEDHANAILQGRRLHKN